MVSHIEQGQKFEWIVLLPLFQKTRSKWGASVEHASEMAQAQLWDARNLQWKILFKRTWLLLILLGRQKFFVHERFEDICDAMKFGVDKKKRVFQRGKSVILVMVRVINWISDIFCVLSFYLIRSWDVGDTFPGALKISAMYLRYVVPTTPGNDVSKCFIWLAVIFRGNTWKMSENSGKSVDFGWHAGALLHPVSSLVHTARSIVPRDDEITSLSAVWILNGSALGFALIFFHEDQWHQ